jgi:hypothetical protein
MFDTLQKERIEMLETIQTNNEKSVSELRTLRNDLNSWKDRCINSEKIVKIEREKANAMQKLAHALREKNHENEQIASQREERMQKELELAERAARIARDKANEAERYAIQAEEKSRKELELAERATKIAKEEAEAAQLRASRMEERELLTSSLGSNLSTSENYP